MRIATTIALCVAILLGNGLAFAGKGDLILGKVVIQQDVERVWLYNADEDASFAYVEGGNRNDRTVPLRNVRDTYDVTGVTEKGQPCRNGLGYYLAGHGWACASSFDVVERGTLPMVDGQMALDVVRAGSDAASGLSDIEAKMAERADDFKAALAEAKDIEATPVAIEATPVAIEAASAVVEATPAVMPEQEVKEENSLAEAVGEPVAVEKSASEKVAEITSGKADKESVEDEAQKMNSMDDRYAAIRERVESDDIQTVTPEQRRFVRLSRNYMNRFVCETGLENVLIPGNKDVEVVQRKTDFVLRVGDGAPKNQFMLDLFVDCGGKTYEMNAAVDSILPSQRIVLAPGSVVERDLSDYKRVITEANALPQEEKITKIFRRVFDKDYLQVWEVSEKNIQDGPYYLNRIVRTYFGDDHSMKVLDFLYEGKATKAGVLSYLSGGLRGERVIAIGIADIPEKGASRVLVLTQGR